MPTVASQNIIGDTFCFWIREAMSTKVVTVFLPMAVSHCLATRVASELDERDRSVKIKY